MENNGIIDSQTLFNLSKISYKESFENLVTLVKLNAVSQNPAVPLFHHQKTSSATHHTLIDLGQLKNLVEPDFKQLDARNSLLKQCVEQSL